jgi:ATP-dependent Clp protease ATP-binding subunit ClpC
LLGLVKEGSGVGATVLKNFDIDLRKVRLEVEKLVKSGPDIISLGKLPQTPRMKKAIEFSIEEARNLGHDHVGTEHLLLGLLREADGIAAQVLMNLGLKLNDVREEVIHTFAAKTQDGKIPQVESINTNMTWFIPATETGRSVKSPLDVAFGVAQKSIRDLIGLLVLPATPTELADLMVILVKINEMETKYKNKT